MSEHKEKVKFEQKNDVMKLIIQNNFSAPESLLEFLVSFSLDVSNIFVNREGKDETIN